MELSPRSIGEAGPGGGGTQRVRCWKCQTNFLVLRTATRGICPECGSQTALHRLRMPMMPSAEIKAEAESREGVLQSDGEAGFGEEVRDLFGPERAGSSLKGVTVLENGGPGPKPGGGRKRGSSGAERGQCEGRGRMVARVRAATGPGPEETVAGKGFVLIGAEIARDCLLAVSFVHPEIRTCVR